MKTYVKCPYCNSKLFVPNENRNSKRLLCPECNQEFDSPLQTQMKAKKRGQNYKNIIAFIIIISVCIIVYNTDGCSGTSSALQIGDRIVIVTDTWGTINDDASRELRSAIAAKDYFGMAQLTQSGKVKHIWKGSRGKMIHGSWSQVQVRFEDGTLYWIPSSDVEKEQIR